VPSVSSPGIITGNTGVTTHAGGTYSGSATGGATADLGDVKLTGTPDLPVTPDSGPTLTGTPDLPVTPGGVPTVVTPVFPVIIPGDETDGTDGTTRTPGQGGPIQGINLPPGLNPGWIAPTPFYNTTSPAQSQFYWGSHPFQAGPTFDANLYNQSYGAPQTPWGQQNIARPLTPAELTRVAQGGNLNRAPLPVATRVQQPVIQQLQTQPYTTTATALPQTQQVVAPVVPA